MVIMWRGTWGAVNLVRLRPAAAEALSKIETLGFALLYPSYNYNCLAY